MDAKHRKVYLIIVKVKCKTLYQRRAFALPLRVREEKEEGEGGEGGKEGCIKGGQIDFFMHMQHWESSCLILLFAFRSSS